MCAPNWNSSFHIFNAVSSGNILLWHQKCRAHRSLINHSDTKLNELVLKPVNLTVLEDGCLLRCGAVPLKRRLIYTRLHGAKSQKAAIFIFVAARIWNLTFTVFDIIFTERCKYKNKCVPVVGNWWRRVNGDTPFHCPHIVWRRILYRKWKSIATGIRGDKQFLY
jgi:hypothetical protein